MKKAAILILVLLNVGLVTALLVNSAKPAQAQIGGGSSYMVVAGHMGGNIGTENDGLYITDVVASVARPVMALKAFKRIHLKAGEEQKVQFSITPDMLSLLDKDLKPVVEPGDFRLMIGVSSEDIRLRGILKVGK